MSYQLVTDSIENWSASYTGPKFHAVLCDPPYGIQFMGKDWDVVSAREWGEALLPHLYPGALLLMFGGTRTWHKLATGMEEAGFEMWDTLMWLYGTGFPKGQDISKLIDKKNGDKRNVSEWYDRYKDGGTRQEQTEGTHNLPISNAANGNERTVPATSLSAPWAGHKTPALKPAWEPILAFRAPTKQTYAALAMEYGSGAMNVDGARITVEANDRHEYGVSGDEKPKDSTAYGDFGRVAYEQHTQGRYPANLILDEDAGAQLDEQSGVSKSTGGQASLGAFRNGDIYSAGKDVREKRNPGLGDVGASRFFYCTKASTKERNAGLDDMPDKPFGMSNQAKAEIKRGTVDFENSDLGVNSVRKVKNTHPTVKPIALTQYLATLLLPPAAVAPRRLLVPFAGSGSEIIGALKAGWEEIVAIEREPEYTLIGEARVRHAQVTA